MTNSKEISDKNLETVAGGADNGIIVRHSNNSTQGMYISM